MATQYEDVKWGDPDFGTAGGTVTYCFAAPTSDTYYDYDAALTAQYQAVIADVFDEWSSYADIEFVQTTDVASADIVLGWDTIDGAGGILGETVYWYDSSGELSSAEVRFDLSDTWGLTADTTGRGAYDFEAVALHEIGHALGLAHASSTDSIMYPYYGIQLDLTNTDISGIEALYGVQQGAVDGSWVYGQSYDYGGWEYGGHYSGGLTVGWHVESGWDYGWYVGADGWDVGEYFHSGWEYGEYGYGTWSTGWYYDYGGWGLGWNMGSATGGDYGNEYGFAWTPSWVYGQSYDTGGWNYGWHTSGAWAVGWHVESGWDYGWYVDGAGWTVGNYFHSGWEYGWYHGGAWAYGWYYDEGGWGIGWNLGSATGGWGGTEYGVGTVGSAGESASWTYGWSYDQGGWNYGWHTSGAWAVGWHVESGWDYGWYLDASGWEVGNYYHTGWEYGWFHAGAWSYGWFYDDGGWGLGWNLGSDFGGVAGSEW